MHLHRPADALSFLRIAGDFLSAREAVRNLPLSIARQCVDDPWRYPGPNYFAAVEDVTGIEGVALMTPPHRVQLFVEPESAIALVSDDLVAGEWQVSGVFGPEAAARAFVEVWCGRSGARPLSPRKSRTFELTEVTQAPPTTGAMRLAGPADLPFVEMSYRAFQTEVDLQASNRSAAELAGRTLRQERVFVWDNGGPVAQAVINGTTPRGVRIGMVFTPPEHRRHGYATALVGALSQRVLDEGNSFCFLFTDLANPVSNSIYPKVGYRAVADFAEIDFMGRLP